MLDIDELADVINAAIGATDRNGDPISTTPYMRAYAQAAVDTFHAGILANAPGTITGTQPAPVPSPIVNGAGSNGLITLMSAVWLAALQAVFVTSVGSKLSAESAASTAYLMGASTVSFASGNITGVGTATPLSPGALTAGAGANGTLAGPQGNPWSADVTASQGIANTNIAKQIYTAISNYLISNTVAAYSTGTVNGAFSAGGGPMIGGSGVGGTLT